MSANQFTTSVEYRDIPGCSGYYRAGDDGSIWSRRWRYKPDGGWHKLSLVFMKSGYQYVSLRINGKDYMKSVHRLVLEAFVGPCPAGMECCHNNDIPHDNRLSNLRWDTHRANKKDADRNGFSPPPMRGSLHGLAKLKEVDIPVIRVMIGEGIYQRDIARKFGVSQATISRINVGIRWKHV